jgi:hypothetical protein
MPIARPAARILLPAIFGAKSLRAALKVNLIGLKKYKFGVRGGAMSTFLEAAKKKAARGYRAAFSQVV